MSIRTESDLVLLGTWACGNCGPLEVERRRCENRGVVGAEGVESIGRGLTSSQPSRRSRGIVSSPIGVRDEVTAANDFAAFWP
jgi:hypothetical protein